MKELATQNKDKDYILFAIQAPLKKGNKPRDVLKKCEALQPISGQALQEHVPFDLLRFGEFNVATWFNSGKAVYWEYIDHEFTRGINPDKPPTLYHAESLPNLGTDYVKVFGVTHRRPFAKK